MERPIENLQTLQMKKILSILSNEKWHPFLFWGLVLIRGVFNFSLPLMDKTEARYAEIARIMVETGDWIVPHIDYGVPFWDKPPLSTWASALSISVFGDHAFFVRLPYLLLAVFIGLFLGRYQKKNTFYFPGIVLLSLPEFYLHAGVVSTDLFLSFSVGLVLLSFWEAVQKESSSYWGYLFFAGLGLGLLAKGPIVAILTLPPIGLWCVFTGNIKRAVVTAPWVGGVIITLVLSLPWYAFAEWRSPGFIDYFIVGEHFERYFNSDWKGDKYGFPKQQPLGIVWLFFIAFVLPWSVLLIRLIVKKWKQIKGNPWTLFLLIWMIWTPFFFTSSKSLIHPYILPSMIPVALMIVFFWKEVQYKKTYLGIGIGIPLALFFLLMSGIAKPLYVNNTDKYLVTNLRPEVPVYSLDQKSYSSQFYTKGKIQTIDLNFLTQLIQKKPLAYIRITNKRWNSLPLEIRTQLYKFRENRKTSIYTFKK